jgi:F0F1-type ATP synthase assembly protein I
MTSPVGDRRERLVALLVAGVAIVLLVSSPTWFASGRTGVGVAQLFLGVVLAAVAAFLYRRAQRR